MHVCPPDHLLQLSYSRLHTITMYSYMYLENTIIDKFNLVLES